MKKHMIILCLFGICLFLFSFAQSIAAEYMKDRGRVEIIMPIRTRLIANCSTSYYARRWCEKVGQCCDVANGGLANVVDMWPETLGAEDADMVDVYQGRSIAIFI